MPKIDLLPCPFCGKVEALRMERIPFVYNLVCAVANGGCGASTGWNHATPEEAVKSWNTRASVWLSCSEMMPKKDGEYLCVSNGEFKILPYRNGEFYSTCFDGVLRCCNSSVTCWMPLPEKPKEVQHDEN